MNEERKKKIEVLNSAFAMNFVNDETFFSSMKQILSECGLVVAAQNVSTLTVDQKTRFETLNSAYGMKFVSDEIYLSKIQEILNDSTLTTSQSSSSSSNATSSSSTKAATVKSEAKPVKVAKVVVDPTAQVPVAVAPTVDPAPVVDPTPVPAPPIVKQYALNAAGKKELDIVLSFDTTGSMTPVIGSVRKNLRALTEMLFSNPDYAVKMSVIAHGDYDCAATLLQVVDFSDSADELCNFITNAQLARVGWNDGEAYEQVLHRVKSLSWRPNSRKICVIVGDDLPHEPTFRGNTGNIDWAECVADLTSKDVCFYSVQCASLSIPRARPFYKALAKAHTLGQYILLDQFYMMPELITGLMLKATEDLVALAALEQKMKTGGNYNRHMQQAFDVLLGRAAPPADDDDDVVVLGNAAKRPKLAASNAGHVHNAANNAQGVRIPVPPGRFQRLKVDDALGLKEFVQATGVVFKVGRGFYELTKTEDVSIKKEIVLEELATGDMFTGGEARSILGLSFSGANEKINPNAKGINGVYRAFIQSTSVNRKLVPGSWFLYEIDNV